MLAKAILNQPNTNARMNCGLIIKSWKRCLHLSISLSILLNLVACNHESSGALQQARRNIGSQHQQLIYKYLAGDVAQARESMEQSVRLIEGETVLSPIEHTAYLLNDYCHLYALEKRVGNESAASIYLKKAIEWNLKSLDLLDITEERRKEDIKSFDAEYIMWLSDDMDKGENKGNLPFYVQNIPK